MSENQSAGKSDETLIAQWFSEHELFNKELRKGGSDFSLFMPADCLARITHELAMAAARRNVGPDVLHELHSILNDVRQGSSLLRDRTGLDAMLSEALRRAFAVAKRVEAAVAITKMTAASKVPTSNQESGLDKNRTDIDQHVERAFDLLAHYKDALPPWLAAIDAEQRNRTLAGIEECLRKWLPLAQPARNKLLDELGAVIGDRDAATRLLANAELQPERIACLQGLAAAEIAERLRSVLATSTCSEEIRHWRKLLPPIRRRHNGQRYVDPADRQATWSVSSYWLGELDSRPSRLGASYFLAAACDSVAASRKGQPTPSVRPAILLAHRLRESPDWTHVDAADVVRVVDEQIELAREVEVLLAEIDFGSVDGSSDDKQPDPLADADDWVPISKAARRVLEAAPYGLKQTTALEMVRQMVNRRRAPLPTKHQRGKACVRLSAVMEEMRLKVAHGWSPPGSPRSTQTPPLADQRDDKGQDGA